MTARRPDRLVRRVVPTPWAVKLYNADDQARSLPENKKILEGSS